ncbi:BCCT family transporter [Salipiger mangrovisoli]|uniref:BCCT family transporter n=1 Tax=Salipiger mangrovisoli TaxID=2865933 RepID=A0ABR9X3T8_9RHOB|nr:BCCT family transporter [Salipiger mangrovisoli]MBE9638198.1 BCCT family transporter [Salipiger mangrovisoli]
MKPSAMTLTALALSAGIGLWGILDPRGLGTGAAAIVAAQFESLGWFIMLTASGMLLAAIYLAVSPFGSVRLGPEESRPDFSTPSWIAMLFAAGMGVGLLFYGAAEPLTHFATLSAHYPPSRAAGLALFVTYVNWGLHAWAIYGMVGLAIGFFGFRRGRPLLLSASVEDSFGTARWTRTLGWLFDLMAIVAIAVGLAGSLAMGVFQIQAGLARLLGLAPSPQLTGAVFVAVCLGFAIPLRRELGDGMARLSNIAMILSIGLLLYLLIMGPTSYLMNAMVTGFGRYLFNVLKAGFATAEFLEDDVVGWFKGWTLNYMIWWLAWSPFVGVFIARISRGRTIREFLFGVILAPTLFSVIWFGVFGGLGFYDSLRIEGALAAVTTENLDATTFALLERFPLSALTSGASIVAAFLFVVTSVVSAAFVLAMFATGGAENPPVRLRLTWGAVLAALGLAMVLVGDVTLVRSVIALSAIVFIFIAPILVLCLLRALRREARG